MSDTPETDLMLSNQHHDCIPYDDAAGQLAELCCKLERERDEARNLADSAMWEADRLRSELHKQLVERDKARTELDLWRDGNILHEIHRNELEEAERERDEARRVLQAVVEEFVQQHSHSFCTSHQPTPMHECEFGSNPELGLCSACEAWGDYVRICRQRDTEEETQ
jgi:hypothetical protein